MQFVLVAITPTGERIPAIASLFPREGVWGASTFTTAERAAYFAQILRSWGIASPLEIVPLG